MRNIAVVVSLLTIVGCSKSESDKPTAAPTPSAASNAAATAPATTAKPAAPRASVAMPPGRSPMPTLAEWNAQEKEVTVKGSSALNCETKIVREYLRVNCHGKNDTGGTPTGVVIKKGGRGEAFAYVGEGVANLVVPFVEGLDFEADFSWTDKSHPLIVKWSRGSKKPAIVGVFEGAQSPLDVKNDAVLTEKLCACHRKVTLKNSCEDLIGGPNADCDRTYGNDCGMLLACSRGEPGAWPTCRPGFVNAFVGFCYQQCGTGHPACPANHSCVDLDSTSVCVED